MSGWLPSCPHIFVGVVVGFVTCSVVGRYYASWNIYQPGFDRFHRRAALDTSYFPTASQLRNFAEDRIPPGKIGVVIGGDSVLYGVGQRAGHVWTSRLQALLGNEYEVINVAQRGGAADETGNWVAEMLLAAGRRVILVADFGTCGANVFTGLYSDPSGIRYRDIYWDAHYKGLVKDWPERSARLSSLPSRGKRLELLLMTWLDSWFYFRDMWTALQYLHFGTFYDRTLGVHSFAPRRIFADDESEPAPEHRYRSDLFPLEIQYLKSIAVPCKAGFRPIVESTFRAAFAEPVRKRLVAVFTGYSPHYNAGLDPVEVRGIETNTRVTGEILQAFGAAVVIPKGWNELDYADRAHLAEQGGHKLADLVCVAVMGKAAEIYGVRK